MKRLISLILFTLTMAIANGTDRKLNYFPDGDAFVCVNGSHLYSRALYGSNNSEWRLETSDRPVFATYKKNGCRNLRFRITVSGTTMALDSTEYCEARYVGGRRDYILRDHRWGRGVVRLSVVAFPDREGAVFRFSADSLGKVSIEGIVSNVRGQRFKRYGDLGTNDNPAVSFGPLPGSKPLSLVLAVLPTKNIPLYFTIDGDTLSCGTTRPLPTAMPLPTSIVARWPRASSSTRQTASSIPWAAQW